MGLGQTLGPVPTSHKGKDGKDARKTAAPWPFPHSGSVHTIPAQPPHERALIGNLGRRLPLPGYLTSTRGMATFFCSPTSEGGRMPGFHRPSKKCCRTLE